MQDFDDWALASETVQGGHQPVGTATALVTPGKLTPASVQGLGRDS